MALMSKHKARQMPHLTDLCYCLKLRLRKLPAFKIMLTLRRGRLPIVKKHKSQSEAYQNGKAVPKPSTKHRWKPARLLRSRMVGCAVKVDASLPNQPQQLGSLRDCGF